MSITKFASDGLLRCAWLLLGLLASYSATFHIHTFFKHTCFSYMSIAVDTVDRPSYASVVPVSPLALLACFCSPPDHVHSACVFVTVTHATIHAFFSSTLLVLVTYKRAYTRTFIRTNIRICFSVDVTSRIYGYTVLLVFHASHSALFKILVLNTYVFPICPLQSIPPSSIVRV